MINYPELRAMRKRGVFDQPSLFDGCWLKSSPKWLFLAFLVMLASCSRLGFTAETIDIDRLATAIGKAENSRAHPYGILAHYKHTSPRQACINTIRHFKRDWDGQGDFITALGKRYCPVGSNTDNGTCKYWPDNVRYFYERGLK